MPPGFHAMVGARIFIAVLIFGTVWRLASIHLAASPNPQAKNLGTAMAFQY